MKKFFQKLGAIILGMIGVFAGILLAYCVFYWIWRFVDIPLNKLINTF